MFEGENDYVQHLWTNKQPKQVIGTCRIYIVDGEDTQLFDSLFGRNQVTLQECHNGSVMEIN